MPPQPGTRPQPIRVAVCGLDTESRAELFNAITRRLGPLGNTLGISEQILEVDADGAREATGPIPQASRRAWIGLLTRLFRVGREFAAMVERAQIDEALGEGRTSRFVVTDGSALVDLLAWADAELYREAFDEAAINRLMQYLSGRRKIPFGKWWSFIRKSPEVWLINEFELARPPVPNVLVWAHQPVETVMRRLRSRGEELGPHDAEVFLERLHAGYRQVAQVLRKRHQVEVLECDLSTTTIADAAAGVEEFCQRATGSPAGAGGSRP